MPIKSNIPDQADVQARMETLTAESTRLEKLAGATAPARPKTDADDSFATMEALEAHVAVLSVTTRLAQPPAHAPVVPRITAAPALATASVVSVAATLPKPAVKLTATQKASAALAAMPRPTPAKPATAPAKVAPQTASDRCRLALAAKSAPKAPTAAAVPGVPASPVSRANPNAPRSSFVPSDAVKLAAIHAGQIQSTNETIRLHGEFRKLGVAIPSPRKLTGNPEADFAESGEYNTMLSTTLAALSKMKAASLPGRAKSVRFTTNAAGEQVAILEH